MNQLAAIQELLARHSGLSGTRDYEKVRIIERHAHSLNIESHLGHPLRDQRPDVLEQELEAVRKEIRAIIKRIETLDGWALSVARGAEHHRRLEAAGSDLNKIMAEMQRHETMPKDEWPDKAAIRHLTDLERGLSRPIGVLIRKTEALPQGKGAKPNLHARRVALAAGRALIELTGNPVSYWREATAFAKLTADLFRLFDIKADTRRACEWALSELAKNP